MSTNPLSKEQIHKVLPELPKGYYWRISRNKVSLVKKSKILYWFDYAMYIRDIDDQSHYRVPRPLLERIETAAGFIYNRFIADLEKEIISGNYG